MAQFDNEDLQDLLPLFLLAQLDASGALSPEKAAKAISDVVDRHVAVVSAEVDRLSALLAACPQGIEGHSCCDCLTPAETTLVELIRQAEDEALHGADYTYETVVPVSALRHLVLRGRA